MSKIAYSRYYKNVNIFFNDGRKPTEFKKVVNIKFEVRTGMGLVEQDCVIITNHVIIPSAKMNTFEDFVYDLEEITFDCNITSEKVPF